MDDFLRVFGIWLAEGSSQKNGVIDISQKQVGKANVIKGWVEKLGYNPNYTGASIQFCDTQLRSWLKQFGHSTDKFIPASFKSLSKRQLRILLDAMILGDGSRRGEPKNDCCYATISPQLADDVQEIALKCGYTATLSKRPPKNNGNSFKSNYAIYIITLGEKCKLPKPNDHKDQREWVDYDGYTYCVEVPNHIVFVRRNGKPLWNGNCYYGNAAAGDVSTTVRDFGLVSNGDFDSATTGWIPSSCSIASVSGGLVGNCCQLTLIGADSQFYPDPSSVSGFVIGQQATVTIWVKSGTSGNEPVVVFIPDADWSEWYTFNFVSSATWTKHSYTFTPTANTAFGCAIVKDADAAGTMLFDRISIITPPRSADWITYEDANLLAADGGLTWGAEKNVKSAIHMLFEG
jgi:hypothetical protein